MKFTELTRKQDREHYWQKHVASWHASNLSQVEYCRLNNLPINKFGYWKRRESKGASARLRFFPLVPTATVPIAEPVSALQLNLQEKRFSIEVGGDFSPMVLKRLIATLEQL